MKFQILTFLALAGLASLGNALPKAEMPLNARAVGDTFTVDVASGDTWTLKVYLQTNGAPGTYDSTDTADLTGALDDSIDAAADDDVDVYASISTDEGADINVNLTAAEGYTIGSFDHQDWKDGGSEFVAQLLNQATPDQFRCLVSSAREGGLGIADFTFQSVPATIVTPPKV